MSRKKILAAMMGITLVSLGVLRTHAVRASDHDDGENDQKARALNLTDLYVFREDKEQVNSAAPLGGDATKMVYIMNTHPRSLPNQQYYYSTNAQYEFHIARVGTDKTAAVATTDNIVIRFEFGEKDTNSQQSITMTTIRDGVSTVTTTDSGGNALKTTAAYTISGGLAKAANPNIMTLSVNGSPMTLFVGHRADPFFFNVTGFFQTRLAAAAAGNESQYVGAIGQYEAGTATCGNSGGLCTGPNFTTGYNVSSIVLRLPISWLQANSETVFDNWETINIKQ